MDFDQMMEAAHRRYREDYPQGPAPDRGGIGYPPESPQPGEKITAPIVVLARLHDNMIDHLAAYRVEGDQLVKATDEERDEAYQGVQG